MLREVEAKRRILDEHPREAEGLYIYEPGTHACERCGDYATVAWPCQTVRLLALPYSDPPPLPERVEAVTRQTKRADEYDAVDPRWRHALVWRRGERTEIKRRLRRRERHEARAEIRASEG